MAPTNKKTSASSATKKTANKKGSTNKGSNKSAAAPGTKRHANSQRVPWETLCRRGIRPRRLKQIAYRAGIPSVHSRALEHQCAETVNFLENVMTTALMNTHHCGRKTVTPTFVRHAFSRNCGNYQMNLVGIHSASC